MNLTTLESLAKAAQQFETPEWPDYLHAANPTVILELINRLREAERVIHSAMHRIHSDICSSKHCFECDEARKYLYKVRTEK